MTKDPAFLFELRIGRGENRIKVRAYELEHKHTDSHLYFTVEVRENGRLVFPRGKLYAGVSVHAGNSLDGKTAKKLALELVAMRPGDTDSEYFEGYSDDQRAWAEENGEWLSCIANERYGES
jgi:hypothetical protein